MRTYVVLVGVIVTLAVALVLSVWTAAGASTVRTRYLLDRGSETMPSRLVLRDCANAEDSMSVLYAVSYEPERVVFRCEVP